MQNSLVDNGSNESETKRGLRCFALRRVIGRSCKQCNRHEFMKDQGWQVMVMVSRSRHGQMAKMAQVKPSSVGTQAERRQERRHNQGTNICRKPSSVGTKAERRHNEGTTKAQISVAVMSHCTLMRQSCAPPRGFQGIKYFQIGGVALVASQITKKTQSQLELHGHGGP